MKERKLLSVLRLIFLTALVLASQALADPLRVGVVLPLTGGLAEFGVAAKNGITLAQEEFPDLFHNIEFSYDDDRYEATLALSAYQKLRTANKVDLFYLWGIAPAGAVAPIAESQKQPVLAVTCQRDIGKQKKYVVRFCYQGQSGGELLLQYLRSKGYKRFGIVKTELAFINTVLEGMRENLRDGESIEVVDTFLFENNDFRTAIGKLKAKMFDAVGVFLASGQISKFYRQSAELGFKPVTFGTDFFDSVSEVTNAGGAMSGAVFVAPATNPEFASRYRKRFGNDLQMPWAANAYDFALLLGKNVASVEKASAEQIIQRLKGVKPFQGASNLVAFHEDERLGAGFDFPVTIKSIDGDRITQLEIGEGVLK